MDTIKEILNSGAIFDEVMKIGKAHDLHIDQIGDLDVDTRALCLGQIKKEDFARKISEHLEISTGMADTLVQEINNNILLKIRDFMKGKLEEAPHHIETPDEILKHIEDGGLELPAPEKQPEPAPKAPEPVPETPKPEPVPEPQAQNLTEHLMQNTVVSPKIERKYTVDPYREPLT